MNAEGLARPGERIERGCLRRLLAQDVLACSGEDRRVPCRACAQAKHIGEREVEFSTLTRFDAMGAIKTFTDDDPEAANVAPRTPIATLSFRAAPAFTVRS